MTQSHLLTSGTQPCAGAAGGIQSLAVTRARQLVRRLLWEASGHTAAPPPAWSLSVTAHQVHH